MALDKSFDRYTNKNENIANEELITKFQGYKANPYTEPFLNGRSFIFMTKPFLFLNPYRPESSNQTKEFLSYLNMCKDPYFSMYISGEATKQDLLILNSLSFLDNFDIKSYFLPILTNKSKGFDSLDLTLETYNTFDTKQNYTFPMVTFSTASESSGTFTISVDESSNLDFIKMMRIWVKYIENVSDGTFNANPDMIKNGTIDYMTSLYYFVTEADGRTLKYWAKYTGCFPTSVPYGAFSSRRGDVSISELNIPFVYTIKEDMNPAILEDFNRVSLRLTDFNVENIVEEEITNKNLYSNSEKLEYYSYLTSPILSKKKLAEGYKLLLNSNERDPIVYYNDEESESDLTGDLRSKKFELCFNNETIRDSFIADRIKDDDSWSYEYKGAQIKF